MKQFHYTKRKSILTNTEPTTLEDYCEELQKIADKDLISHNLQISPIHLLQSPPIMTLTKTYKNIEENKK